MLHDWLGDPVDLGVSADGLVEGINHDHFEVLVGRVLSNPVRAEDTESLKTTSNTFLSDGLQVPDWLHLVDHTGCLWLTIGATLGHWTFATSTTHGNAVDHITWN